MGVSPLGLLAEKRGELAFLEASRGNPDPRWEFKNLDFRLMTYTCLVSPKKFINLLFGTEMPKLERGTVI